MLGEAGGAALDRAADQMLRRWCQLLLGAGFVATAHVGPAQTEEVPEPLSFVVRPSGIEGVETLDEKLARRERGLRFICIGCVRAPGGPSPNAPFYPLRVLGAAGLGQAMADSFPPVPPATATDP
jgi:hypothetical protein